MAGASLLVLLDDIAAVLDDVSVMTKVAAKKTAGVLGDDLALNAQQVSGVRAEREIPVVWAVAKGSFVNKLILVPAALLISFIEDQLKAFGYPIPLIMPLLMLGGLYLCFEGFEKIAHPFLHSKAEDEADHKALSEAVQNTEVDLVTFEKEKVQGAIRTDFVLSAEIIVITLGTVASMAFMTKLSVLAGISIIMTVGVYGLVAGIVKMDDAGLYLNQRPSAVAKLLGRGLLAGAPKLMKLLAIVGTLAMFMVGGGIITHGIDFLHHTIEHIGHDAEDIPYFGHTLAILAPSFLNAIAGVVAGAATLAVVTVVGKIVGLFKK
jgi:predicted DNA repair protein MutK